MKHHITVKDMATFTSRKVGHYNYYDARNCPLAQYAKEALGIEFPVVKPYAMVIADETDNSFAATYDPLIERALTRAATNIFGNCDRWDALALELDKLETQSWLDQTTKPLQLEEVS